MRKPNPLLQKNEMKVLKALDVGQDAGFQKCWDLIQLALRDPEAVGKDIFGKERIKKLYNSLRRLERFYGPAWTAEVESDVLQEKLDSELRDIWQDELCVFRDRYPYALIPGYDKSRKDWK